MKRIFRTLLMAVALFFAGQTTASAAGERALPVSNNAGIDTVSYVTGLQLSNNIKNSIVPYFKLDYKTIVSVIDKLVGTDKKIKIEGIVITPDNVQEVGEKIFNEELFKRVSAAASDTTGKTPIFRDIKEQKIAETVFGADIAYGMANAPYPIDKKSFMKALVDNNNGKPLFTESESMEYIQHYYTNVLPKKNLEASNEWLAKNAKKVKGIKTTASGLMYKIVAPGDMNVKPMKDSDKVKVLYTGRTRKGKVFDSNRWADMPADRQKMISQYSPEKAGKDSPIEFALNQVIKGWTEGMKFIGKGGKIVLWIPASLAYGEKGAGDNIGPNEALYFDIELLDVTSK